MATAQITTANINTAPGLRTVNTLAEPHCTERGADTSNPQDSAMSWGEPCAPTRPIGLCKPFSACPRERAAAAASGHAMPHLARRTHGSSRRALALRTFQRLLGSAAVVMAAASAAALYLAASPK